MPDRQRFDQVGYATWYGDELAGERTASGERFDPNAITAAHRSLPLNSVVEVTSLETGQAILVRINDRGPFTTGLILDLSRGAMRLIGSKSRTPVRIRLVEPSAADLNALYRGRPAVARPLVSAAALAVLRQRLGLGALPSGNSPVAAVPSRSPHSAISDGRYLVKVASFSSRDRAKALARALDGRAIKSDDRWRVVLGPFDRFADAQRARDDAARRGYGDAAISR